MPAVSSGLSIATPRDVFTGGGPPSPALLLEDGTYLLLEDGSYLLLG